jgi:hypothetical protein
MGRIQGSDAELSSRCAEPGGTVCTTMALGAVGIVLLVLLGASPAALLLLGLLLLCPAGLWILYRYDRRAVRRFRMLMGRE